MAIICDGDITKSKTVLWEYSFNDIKPFFDIQIDKLKLRKLSLSVYGLDKKAASDYTDEEYLESISHFQFRETKDQRTNDLIKKEKIDAYGKHS